jgi:putative transposase
MPAHRKKRRFINEPGHAHFFTFSCSHRWPLLNRDRSRQWLVDAINTVRAKSNIEVWAYVIMPEHVHLLLMPREKSYDMSRVSAGIKFPVSRNAHQYLQEQGLTSWIDRLTVRRGDKTVFQFWQPGTGYDENLWCDRSIQEVVDYIHANPVRRGLVTRPIDWYWSSARAHAGMGEGPLRVDTIDVN